jgi:nitroreductase
VPYDLERPPPERMRERARSFYERMDARRSVRDFSADPVPRELIELAVRTASTAPSGAHEERISYEGRMSDGWLEALRRLSDRLPDWGRARGRPAAQAARGDPDRAALRRQSTTTLPLMLSGCTVQM